VLKGHTARAFLPSWSPLQPGMLATGSDDASILLWEVNLDQLPSDAVAQREISPLKTLLGHKSNIRALSWNYENRNILLSGSWDATIRIWETGHGVCLSVISDHVADVYSILSHPDRPFTYMSCSRDSTVRVWELTGAFAHLRYRAVKEASLTHVIYNDDDSIPESRRPASLEISEDFDREFGVSTSRKEPFTSAVIDKLREKLRGRKSRLLSVELMKTTVGAIDYTRGDLSVSDRVLLAQSFHRIFNFFSGSNGCLDVLEIVLSLLCRESAKQQIERSGDASAPAPTPTPTLIDSVSTALSTSVMSVARPAHLRVVLTENEVISKAQNEARVCESSKMRARKGEVSAKVEDQLRRVS
jgi:WD domain, G-beta repeat